MIFVAVGTQLPFDRLIRTVDEWAGSAPHGDVLSQIADGEYIPKHIRWERMIAPNAFRQCLEQCQLVVSHAGMGTILSALELGKPVIVLPRQAKYGEHRNDHQLATAERFGARRMIRVAQNESDLPRLLDQFENSEGQARISTDASPELIGNLRSFIDSACESRGRTYA